MTMSVAVQVEAAMLMSYIEVGIGNDRRESCESCEDRCENEHY
jgi:hypothetical protein